MPSLTPPSCTPPAGGPRALYLTPSLNYLFVPRRGDERLPESGEAVIVLLARPSCHSTILLFMRSIFGPAALPLPLLLLLLLLLLTSAAGAPAAGKKDKKRDEKSCDVCLDVINSIISQGMPDVKARPKEERVEAAKTAIVMHCSHQNGSTGSIIIFIRFF